MPIIVQKFGGTSVANSNKILAAARKAIRAQQQGNQVVMVVSAMTLFSPVYGQVSSWNITTFALGAGGS